MNVFWFVAGFGLSNVIRQTPAATELGSLGREIMKRISALCYPTMGGSFFILSLLFLFLSPGAQATVMFTENFDGVLDPNLNISSPTPFSATISGGKAVFEKSSGDAIPGLGARITTNFQVIGDFTTTVVAERIDLATNGTLGLIVFPDAGGFEDVFFTDNTRIGAVFTTPPLSSGQSVNNSASSVVFRIRRTGNTMFEEFDAGSGFEVVNSASHLNLAGPAYVGLFLTQNFGFTGTHKGTFDDFMITADQFSSNAIPEPSTFVLLLCGFVVMLGLGYCQRRRNKATV